MKTFTFQEMREFALDWRGIQDEEAVCNECSGSGVKSYGDTSTYHGGVGGQAITLGVCNHCWGSGNRYKPWPSHKESWSMKRARENQNSKNRKE